jgi:protein involved in polysaccharide export with SLBB domain
LAEGGHPGDAASRKQQLCLLALFGSRLLGSRMPKTKLVMVGYSRLGSFANLVLLTMVAAGIHLAGCSPTGAMRLNAGVDGSAPAEKAANRLAPILSENEAARLDRLRQQREAASSATDDYPIGPGDVLTISVADVEELQQRKVRVSAEGLIELPLIGLVQTEGLTEDGLAEAIDKKLENLMYKPQASVFVDEYRNREAAVVGEVNKPGMVLLETPWETILDVLTQAGGVNSVAADEVILIPARLGNTQAARLLPVLREDNTHAAVGPRLAIADGAASTDRPLPADHGADPQIVQKDGAAATEFAVRHAAEAVRIPLRSDSLTGSGSYLSLPVRPGDVLVVPGGGQVMVVGWVQSPGHFSVGSGLTVLGAIGAAGGPMYAADTRAVSLIRSAQNGSKETILLDLDKISRDEAPDIAVEANDVIDVPYSGLRIGPYIFYSILTRVGVNGPMIPY